MRILIALLLLLLNASLSAHQTKPAIVDITFKKNATIELHIRTNLEALIAEIGPQHKDTEDAPQAILYRQLREFPAEKLEAQFIDFDKQYRQGLKLVLTGASQAHTVSWKLAKISIPPVADTRISRNSDLYYTSTLLPDVTAASWQYSEKFGDNIVRFMLEGEDKQTSYWLTRGKQSPEYLISKEVIPQSRIEIAKNYTILGFEHILPKGVDHILFVLGLFLLSFKFKPLLWQVTAFTVAHSITLGMSIYGLISLSPAIVEPLIALSIAYVGIENIVTKELKPWRIIIVFLFGLLHGMGFATVLTELGLPRSEFVTALITFNIGVELGQLSVILIAFMAVGWLSKKPDLYRKLVVIPGSMAIALMGLYWTWERVFY